MFTSSANRCRQVCGILFGFLILCSATALAQEPDSKGDADRMVVDARTKTQIPKPEGWVKAKPPKGSVALFRVAGGDPSQIDVRATPDIEEERRDVFFTSFHSNLVKKGLKKLRQDEDVAYGVQTGKETEYEAMSAEQPYRVVVWETYLDQTAWLVVGFFPKQRRSEDYQTFQELIRSVKWP